MMRNLPNLITCFRLTLLPLVCALMWPGRATPTGVFWAACAYVVAGIFDVVDGAIARRTGTVTGLGQFLDPLVDKLFYLVTLIALLQLPGPWVPPWVVMLTLIRELAVTGLRGIAAGEGIVIPAGEGGKIKTSFATAGIVSLILHYPCTIYLGVTTLVVDARVVGLWLTYISLVYSCSSAYGYARAFIRAMMARSRVRVS
jgi:CDP-diacylglycerol--glycerol-3-phosphate 3-phosphatidyltransferase